MKFYFDDIKMYSESLLKLSLVNITIRLMRSHFKIPQKTGYCYHSVNVINIGLAQSDHINRLLLYKDYLQNKSSMI